MRTAAVLIVLCLASNLSAGVSLRCQPGEIERPGLKLGTPMEQPFELDFRYAPPDWQTAICLPDDWQKTLVGRDGVMLYDYDAGDFATRIRLTLGEGEEWLGQELESPRIPVVVTRSSRDGIELTARTFAVASLQSWPSPPTRRFMSDAGAPGSVAGENEAPAGASKPARADLLLATFTNTQAAPAEARPILRIDSKRPLRFESGSSTVWIGDRPMVSVPEGSSVAVPGDHELLVALPPVSLAAGKSQEAAIAIHHHADAMAWTTADAERALRAARGFWQECDLPYGRIRVPDARIQAMIDASIRNIYQAREIKKGLPAFQVGPTCYRGLWIVDGAFLLEAITMLHREQETRAGVEYMLNHQNADGSFELLERYWKETGIVLWVIDRHEQLTGDRDWLEGHWPRVEKAVAFIQSLRKRASADPQAPHAGLVPPGFPDGGLMGPISEYTNVYWLLIGLKSAAGMAERMGRAQQATAWKREFEDMWKVFRGSAERDLFTDPFGNRMLPVPMSRPLEKAPHKALWAFCHAIYPGELFAPDDPIMLGTLASLTDNECEGLVKGTGWLDDGLWNYFGSFYGHAFAWLGRGRKAAEVLYAFGNHASPLYAWREEHMPKGRPHTICGDMPHNWASAEFIRLALHLLVMERGDELHLLEGLPPNWLKPGSEVAVDRVLTRCGLISFTLRVGDDGRTADLDIVFPARLDSARVVVHTGDWAESVFLGGGLELGKRTFVTDDRDSIRLQLKLKPRAD